VTGLTALGAVEARGYALIKGEEETAPAPPNAIEDDWSARLQQCGSSSWLERESHHALP
jgi:hypothetical protein